MANNAWTNAEREAEKEALEAVPALDGVESSPKKSANEQVDQDIENALPVVDGAPSKANLSEPLVGDGPKRHGLHAMLTQHKQVWDTLHDDEATANLNAFKEWMLESKWIVNRDRVERAFMVIEEDIAVSIGANGDVEDLVVGPAIPYCYKANAAGFIGFFIILALTIAFSRVNHFKIASYPSGTLLLAVLSVFTASTGVSMYYEYCASMFVLPAQAIACGGDLVKDPKKGPSFNRWAFGMLVISYLYSLDLMSTAIFVGRIWVSSDMCPELNDDWQASLQSSPIRFIPIISDLPFKTFVQLGALLLIVQLLVSLAFSYPLSPNFANVYANEHDRGDDVHTQFQWPDYLMTDLKKGEVLSHPNYLVTGAKIGDPGDWPDRPEAHKVKIGDEIDGKPVRQLDDTMLITPSEEKEGRQMKAARASKFVRYMEKHNGQKDNYKMRLARHRRSRVAVYHSFFRPNNTYGRSVQALVESGRMNLMQWQDDAYLRQAEHSWPAARMVDEMRRVNVRFTLFALQSAFLPNFQITFFGIVKAHEFSLKIYRPDAAGTNTYSNYLTAATTILSLIMGIKYLIYEAQSIRFHEKFAWIAIDNFKAVAEKKVDMRKRWEGRRLATKAKFSQAFNWTMVTIFFFFYLYLGAKVVMAILVCDTGIWNVAFPWTKGGGMAHGCVAVKDLPKGGNNTCFYWKTDEDRWDLVTNFTR